MLKVTVLLSQQNLLYEDLKAHTNRSGTPYSRSIPHKEHSNMPSPDPQNTCKLERFLLKLSFDVWSETLFQHPGISCSREGGQCHTPIIRTHSPVPLFKNGHCSRPPCNIEEACQPWHPNNVQSLQQHRANLFHTWRLTRCGWEY